MNSESIRLISIEMKANDKITNQFKNQRNINQLYLKILLDSNDKDGVRFCRPSNHSF